jgi:cytochrome c-type biogenesis protein CcmH
MIWVVFALLTCAAVLSILWPLTGRAPEASAESGDVAFYRAQIAEIDSELSRGGMAREAAEAARALAARRLLAAGPADGPGDSPRAQRLAAVLAVLGAPAIALALYARIGHPNWPDQPLQARLSAPPAQQSLSASVARMEAYLAGHKDDGRALELMTPAYLEMGRYADAVDAIKKAIDLLGESPERLVKYAEALSYANDGVVSPEAVDQLERALALDGRNLQARYYLALAAAQHDDRDKAREVWTAMLAEMPDGSRAKQDVLDKLAMLDAPVEGAPPPDAAPDSERQKTVEGMVERLAQRLAAQGGGLEDWTRLIRSYAALKERAKAEAALGEARKALISDAAAQKSLAATAKELGLAGD